MARYIDADKMKNSICFYDGADGDTYAKVTGNILREWIDQRPSEDVVPVVHGHWIDCHGNYVSMDANGIVDGECLCSVCGDYLIASDEYGVRGFYCPNCGTKMDEEVQ